MVITGYAVAVAVENIIVTMEEDLAAIHHQQILDILVEVTLLMVLDILIMPLISIDGMAGTGGGGAGISPNFPSGPQTDPTGAGGSGGSGVVLIAYQSHDIIIKNF